MNGTTIKTGTVQTALASSLSVMLLLIVLACSDDEKIDTEYPFIDASYSAASPAQCSVLKRGEAFMFRARFTDNRQLGSFSLDIHHNFDHHTHSTEVRDCDMYPVRTPVKPFLMIRDFPIPPGLREYDAEVAIEVPADIDAGDYHLMILLTDHEGWQSIRGISIKIE